MQKPNRLSLAQDLEGTPELLGVTRPGKAGLLVPSPLHASVTHWALSAAPGTHCSPGDPSAHQKGGQPLPGS